MDTNLSAHLRVKFPFAYLWRLRLATLLARVMAWLIGAEIKVEAK